MSPAGEGRGSIKSAVLRGFAVGYSAAIAAGLVVVGGL
jgi:hypothetical protein